MLKPAGLFITGTDTGIGKTHATVHLMRLLQSRGLRVAGMKPVASGAEWINGRWMNQDAIRLQQASSMPLPYEWVNPYVFPQPASPHLASAMAGNAPVNLERIQDRCHDLARLADCVIVEGVGGWCVPLNNHQDVGDLATLLGFAAIQVVGLRLGCINHALLTHQSMQSSGVRMGGWLANHVISDLPMAVDMIDSIAARTGSQPLVELPFVRDPVSSEYPQENQWKCDVILRLMTP